MDDSTLAARLTQLGLSEKEIDTYLSILENGEAKASEVADDTGVSKRYVYSISESLEDRGFVEVNDHVVPTTIRARPPSEVISSLTDQLEEMESALDSRFSDTKRRAQQFDVIKSRVTVVKRLAEYVADADREIMLSVPEEHLPELADELSAAVDRGVLVMLVVNGVSDLDRVDADGLASVARAWDREMPIMLTVDGQLSPSFRNSSSPSSRARSSATTGRWRPRPTSPTRSTSHLRPGASGRRSSSRRSGSGTTTTHRRCPRASARYRPPMTPER